ncbi:MAG: hypothetical protein NC429_14170 [Lachnospiraceae bacterium]|nr:hypothetical protein [Lachnospiraceae bacterium]
MRTFYGRSIRRLLSRGAITILLVVIGALFLSMAAHSQSEKLVKEQKEYYKTLEQEYVEALRNLLEEQGYSNSGITMNRVIEEDGTTQYIVTIHHGRIEHLDDKEKSDLLSKCEEVEFPERDCSFYHKFLETSF